MNHFGRTCCATHMMGKVALRVLILFSIIGVVMSQDNDPDFVFVGAGLPKDDIGDSYGQLNIEGVASAVDCKTQCNGASYPEGPPRGFSHNSDTSVCYCWSGGNSSIQSVDDTHVIYGHTYCDGCDVSKEPTHNATDVGPTETKWLTMTLFGIHKLKNEEEWSKYTAAFATKYILGAGNVYEATTDIYAVKQQPVFKLRDDSCGCLQCTTEIMATMACDDQDHCSTCEDRIAYLQSQGKPQREACSQVAGLEFNEACGSCNPLTCNQPTSFCGCPQCTPEVWSMETCDDDSGYCSTCGERITYLHGAGNSERDACIQTAGSEYEESCGPCNPLTCNQPTTFCGCPECTEEIWASNACDENGFCSTCGERINFLQMIGKTERDACIQISGNEHHGPCGQCNPLLCGSEPPDPSILSDISTLITYTQTSTYKTSNPSVYDPSYVIHEPFAEKGAQSEYVAYLQTQSTDYDGIISVSPVVVSPPPPVVNGGDDGGPSVRNIIIATVAGLYALAVVLREIIKIDKYDEGVGERGPGQHPPERPPEQRPPWQYPSEVSYDSEEMDDDVPTSPRETDSLVNGDDSPSSPKDKLVDGDDDCPVSLNVTGSFELVELHHDKKD